MAKSLLGRQQQPGKLSCHLLANPEIQRSFLAHPSGRLALFMSRRSRFLREQKPGSDMAVRGRIISLKCCCYSDRAKIPFAGELWEEIEPTICATAAIRQLCSASLIKTR
ncbi:unnamed protein product [Heligmosomoides polygyrus]|uniref:Uncharacterized protein n=1 Tax=Heligmosomoides polygyrus TaxID=6339 RepID=A0A183G3K4_HELPZ|nr:unnamed protein product [Heligmosomoides polygyrus]